MIDNKKVFKSNDGLELVVSYKKSAVIFEVGNNEVDNILRFYFNINIFKELFQYLKKISNKVWGGVQLKECNSMGSDYAEYYDRQLDNNGYLELNKNRLTLERVSLGKNKLYQFNKRKMEAFLYDFNKIIK